MGPGRRTLRGVELQADRVAELAGRPLGELRRRDVALALLSVAPNDALGSLPGIRRGLVAAGNPLSAPFWESAEVILHKISDTHVIERLQRTVPGIDGSLWRRLPGLAPGQAIVSLASMTRPLLVSMDPAPCALRLVE